MKKEGDLSDSLYKDLREKAARVIEEAVSYAQEAPFPRPEEALEDLFVNP